MSKLARISQKIQVLTQWSLWALLLRALECECRNFLHRIGSIHRSWIYREGLQIGSEYHSIPWADFQRCTRTHACISDIRSLRMARPWITVADVEIFLEGWKLGVECPHCMICNKSEPYVDIDSQVLSLLTQYPENNLMERIQHICRDYQGTPICEKLGMILAAGLKG